jgi:hypothetical protein
MRRRPDCPFEGRWARSKKLPSGGAIAQPEGNVVVVQR